MWHGGGFNIDLILRMPHAVCHITVCVLAYQPAGDDITLLTAGREINPHICMSMFLFRLGLIWLTSAVDCSEKDGESLTCYHYYEVNNGRVVELKGYFVFLARAGLLTQT